MAEESKSVLFSVFMKTRMFLQKAPFSLTSLVTDAYLNLASFAVGPVFNSMFMFLGHRTALSKLSKYSTHRFPNAGQE